MERAELEEKIIGFFTKVFKKYTNPITLETRMKEDLKCKSLQTIAVLARVESELGTGVSLADASRCATVSDFADLVESKM